MVFNGRRGRPSSCVADLQEEILCSQESESSEWEGIQATNTSHCPLAKETFVVIFKRHNYLTPDLWKRDWVHQSLHQELTSHLVKTHTWVSIQRIQTSAVTTREAFYTRKIKCVKPVFKMMLMPWEALLMTSTFTFSSISHFQCLLCPIDIDTGWREGT